MSKLRMPLMALAGTVVLALPAAALGQPGHGHGKGVLGAPSTQSHGKGHGRGRNLVFKGKVSAVDTTAGTVTVTISSGNHAVRTYVGQDVVFDVKLTKLRVADTNGDGIRNELNDIRVGDRVVVHVLLAKGTPATQPLAARTLLDQSASGNKAS